MSRIIFDAEADGFLEVATNVHCLLTTDLDTGERRVYVDAAYTLVYDCKGSIQDGLGYLAQATELVGQNIIGYDLPLFKKLHNWEAPSTAILTDTLIYSKLVNPDIRMVKGCRSGPHSVEAYGIRFGRASAGEKQVGS